MDNKKVLFIGDFFCSTGFARVLESIAKYLPTDKYSISVMAINYFGDYHEDQGKYRVYPAGNEGDVYGFNRLDKICKAEKPNIIYLLNDIWILTKYLQILKQIYKDTERPKIVIYFPVDAEDHDPDWYLHLDFVDEAVVYTRFAYDVAKKAFPDGKFKIIPHGVDTNDFYPIHLSRTEIKKQLYPPDRDDYINSFIVLSAARNQPRKKLDIVMRAFKLFAEGKPANVKLYMHCGVLDSSMDIITLAQRLNLEDRLIISSTQPGVQNVTVARLNLIYNATEIGVNTSLGEGWCLPSMEHAVTGAPQVVPDHSALHEIYEKCGLLVPAKIPFLLNEVMTTGYLVTPEDVAEKMNLLYKDAELYKKLSIRGVTKFSSSKYSWKNIAEMWDKVFTGLFDESDISK